MVEENTHNVLLVPWVTSANSSRGTRIKTAFVTVNTAKIDGDIVIEVIFELVKSMVCWNDFGNASPSTSHTDIQLTSEETSSVSEGLEYKNKSKHKGNF